MHTASKGKYYRTPKPARSPKSVMVHDNTMAIPAISQSAASPQPAPGQPQKSWQNVSPPTSTSILNSLRFTSVHRDQPVAGGRSHYLFFYFFFFNFFFLFVDLTRRHAYMHAYMHTVCTYRPGRAAVHVRNHDCNLFKA